MVYIQKNNADKSLLSACEVLDDLIVRQGDARIAKATRTPTFIPNYHESVQFSHARKKPMCL